METDDGDLRLRKLARVKDDGYFGYDIIDGNIVNHTTHGSSTATSLDHVPPMLPSQMTFSVDSPGPC